MSPMMQRDTTGLTAENKELKLRLEAMEQQARLRDGMPNNKVFVFYLDGGLLLSSFHVGINKLHESISQIFMIIWKIVPHKIVQSQCILI